MGGSGNDDNQEEGVKRGEAGWIYGDGDGKDETDVTISR